jgi:CheY-like chemotaxis protein
MVKKAGLFILKQGSSAKTILLVEDNDVVRQVTLRILQHLGYKTLSANDGEEAIRIVATKEPDNQIDIVLLDFELPKMSGKDTYKNLVRLRPNLPVIFITGNKIDKEAKLLRNDNIDVEFIQKPYTKDILHATISKVLTTRT